MTSPRIISLLPGTTEIVGALGLSDHLVGVTHECDVCPDAAGMARLMERGVERVTTSGIDPHAMTQGAIDDAVKSSLSAGLSLYEVREDALRRARPDVVLTQALCSVCAPAYGEVKDMCQRLGTALADERGHEPEVLSLEPANLQEVAESFVTVAAACGAEERGISLKQEFESRLNALRGITANAPRPAVLLLEWLDPPFDGGHWVPEQIEAAGGQPLTGAAHGKSKQLSWDQIEAADPDVIVVACCGFDLARNTADVQALLAPGNQSEAGRRLRALRAVENGRLYALDGNRYYARPSPSLAPGAAVLARVIHGADPSLVERLRALDFLPCEGEGWVHVEVKPPQAAIGDPLHGSGAGFVELHEQACAAGRSSYTDAETGYRVFTRVGLQRRGSCCGCGCRHCPYGHINVEDKAARIQQPAFLHRRASSAGRDQPRHVLFWSGGKDSLLALRAWLRVRLADGAETAADLLDSVLLMTTFDAASRSVAHQEIPIALIQRQAESLDLDLVAAPLHPGMDYVDRVKSGLDRVTAEGNRIASLVFGDLHLAHIRQWRDEALSRFGLCLDYPLWQRDPSTLMEDLLRSEVPCILSACPGTVPGPLPDGIRVGRRFDPQLAESARRAGWDPFGENGEFHTLAQVWQVPAARALGIIP